MEFQLLASIGILCGLLVALNSIIVQIGWFIHSATLVQISLDFSPMKYNSALCFLFCAINLLFFNKSSRILRSTGLLATFIALITLSQYIFNKNYGIDTFFVKPFTTFNSQFSGRMSPVTCTCFIIIGSMLFFAANFKLSTSQRAMVVFLTSIVTAFTIIPLLAYLSRIETAYLWSFFTKMAVHTATSFIFLSIGLICRIWSQYKGTPYFLMIPVVLCLTTITFSTSGAIYTYENLKYHDLLKEEAYYTQGKVETPKPPIQNNLLHRESSYVAYLVLFFGLLTSLLLSLTTYFRIKWQQNAQALQDSEQRLHLAITGTTDGLYDWNIVTGEFYYSPRFEEVLGYQPNTLNPQYETFLKLINPHDLEKFNQNITEHFKHKKPINLEFRLKTKTDDYIWFNFRGAPTHSKTGKMIRMTGFIADISLRNEIDKMKNEFISTVSHELRTPMTAIRGSLALILSDKVGSFDGKIRELLIIAERNCDRLLQLINDMLDIEKIESGKIHFNLTVCDLATIVKEAVAQNHMLATEFNIKLIFLPLMDIQVKVDIYRLIQVITNLISNAVKFSKSGDTVTITMAKDNKHVRVNVIDQGPGISEKFKKRIFQKFSQADSSATRENKGSGLGLSISKAIIEELDGSLGFTSTPNEGSTFYFELPIANA